MSIAAGFHSAPPTAPAAGRDRRRFTRHRLIEPLPAIIGRCQGLLLDISANGARVRHDAALALGTRARLTFLWEGRRFEATAEVLACRVAALGRTSRFESRLRFVALAEPSQEVLACVLTDLLDRDLRKWVANLHGWCDETPGTTAGDDPAASGYIRCRYIAGRWQQTPTREALTPPDGFVVPAGTAPAEIRSLCRTWESSDEDGRTLVRLITDAVVRR